MIAFFPAVKNKASDKKRSSRQVNNGGVQTFGWFFAKLLGCFSANRTLSIKIRSEK